MTDISPPFADHTIPDSDDVATEARPNDFAKRRLAPDMVKSQEGYVG